MLPAPGLFNSENLSFCRSSVYFCSEVLRCLHIGTFGENLNGMGRVSWKMSSGAPLVEMRAGFRSEECLRHTGDGRPGKLAVELQDKGISVQREQALALGCKS